MSDCNNNCEAVAGLNEAAANIVQYRNLINSWLNGAANATVNVAGVNTPTLLKLVTDLRTRINQMPQSILQQNGGIAIDENGKLYINFATMPDSILYGLLQKIVLEDGGLAFNNQGKMYVDFASMPTDKFDEILETFRKGLSLPKWLKANKNFYVDWENGTDPAENNIPEGWGESPDKAFASIQACVNYISNDFNMSRFTAYIIIKGGTYGPVTLPEYTRTTGKVSLLSNGHVIIKRNGLGAVVSSNGPHWQLNGDFEIVSSVNFAGVSGVTDIYNPCVLNSKGSLECFGLDLKISISGNNNTGRIRSFFGYLCTGGDIVIHPVPTRHSKLAVTNASPGTVTCVGMSAEGGSFSLISTPDNTISNIFEASGPFSVFARSSGIGSSIVKHMAYSNPMSFLNNATGKRYECAAGGAINTVGSGPDYFPGNENGTVESSTYSWYK